ncbi:MAG: DNA-methyltransferase [Salinispira sp.]
MEQHSSLMTMQKSAMQVNSFYTGNAVDLLNHSCEEASIDLTVTSPPYDDLRNYKGYSFDPAEMLSAVYRVTKPGGVCVWVVGERISGSRSLSSFDHAFIGRDCGFLVHDVMIYQKKNTPFMRSNAYTNCYELMLVFVKGRPKTFNPLKVPTKRNGWETAVSNKGPDAVNRKRPVELKKEKTRTNIWQYAVGLGGSTTDKIAFRHPAIFPEKLAGDHILSWTNPGDLVLDPMCGSGTTCKMARLNGRQWIGIDISQEYIDIASERNSHQ